MNRRPKVSVIMPVYNSVNYIDETLDSIFTQTFTDFELIIVDDYSNDGTRGRIESYTDERVKILHNEKNMGVAYSRNRALEYCSGEYIAIMDHDDISLPTRLEREVDFLDKNREYGVVGGRIQLIGADGEIIKKTNVAYVNPNYIKAIFLFHNVYCNSEVMFRRELLNDKTLRYEDNCYGMEDFKFWIKLSKITKMGNVDELFLKHRIHSQSITNHMSESYQKEREEKFAQLQDYSWQLSGLHIPSHCAQVIHKYVKEELLTEGITNQEIEELYHALRVFVKECKEQDNYKEISIYCKKIVIQYINRMKDFWKEESL